MEYVVFLSFAFAIGPVLWPAVLPARTPRGHRYRWLTFVLFGVAGLAWAWFTFGVDAAAPAAVYYGSFGLAVLSTALFIFAGVICREERKKELRPVEVPFQPAPRDAE